MINDRAVGVYLRTGRAAMTNLARDEALKIDMLQNTWLDYYATSPKRKRAMNNSPRDNLRFNQAAVFRRVRTYARTHNRYNAA